MNATSSPVMRAARIVAAATLLLAPLAPAVAATSAGPVAWLPAASDADVDRAFATARAEGKPVFLYWGAVWCPPCNQVKATLFNRPDFVERSRAFVPVYVDGDKPGAQKIAARFKVSGYPTMVLFKPDGTEITRLPGEVDPERYLLTLTAGMDAQVPVKDLVRRALAGQALSTQQWRLLAYYSWDTDEQQVLPTAQLPATLAGLAAAAPASDGALRDRLALKALAAASRAEGKPDPAGQAAGLQLVDRVLADPAAVRALADVLVGYADGIARHVAVDNTRRELALRWDAALARLAQDPSISRSERVDVLDARVSLWKIASEPQPLDNAKREQLRQEVASIVAGATDRYERQAVVPNAASVLAEAGLLDASDALLKAELPRAVAPYYHMLGLASNANKRGDTRAALDWYEQAWRKSEGPATRIQWGAGYVGHVLELTPSDLKRVAAAGNALVAELAPRGETFYERNQRSLQRLAGKLARWKAGDPARARVVAGLQGKLGRVCGKLPARDPGRANCAKVFQAQAAKPSSPAV
ncbi:thioredoxin family protein [Caenimonas terrae]|uniref:Thioredoxin family protein n=1 Tax=Caenimonas terrae TaxID=696074 RepID=A0ABW0NK97_9BURK